MKRLTKAEKEEVGAAIRTRIAYIDQLYLQQSIEAGEWGQSTDLLELAHARLGLKEPVAIHRLIGRRS